MALPEAIVKAAKAALAEELDLEVRITLIASYVEQLEQLLSLLQHDSNPTGVAREDLEQIGALHPQIISMALRLLGNTSIDLQQLQAKGKAILAYTDTLPKRVSMRSEKRG